MQIFLHRIWIFLYWNPTIVVIYNCVNRSYFFQISNSLYLVFPFNQQFASKITLAENAMEKDAIFLSTSRGRSVFFRAFDGTMP